MHQIHAAEWINEIAFNPDGSRLVATGREGIIHLEDPDNPGAGARTLRGHEGMIWSVAFSPDSKTLASSADDDVLLWDLTHPLNTAPLEDIANLVCQKVWRNLTLDEWREFVSEDLPYERTCPDLPTHPSVTDDG